uniref:Serine/threonine-protein phosphatase 4 regulatory subunit 3-like central domain-containing protein n=1 Tax=Percolomonas cosmopolitus TaxID=63605 RepID=A0A6U0K360_9EUKA|mmetsp:Transcript_1884/g.6706  ORF Transcript_1884/g.6706 Transcript_1884/m.6706 type:complete len:1011 (+) Transcript_1884:410-3442(+)
MSKIDTAARGDDESHRGSVVASGMGNAIGTQIEQQQQGNANAPTTNATPSTTVAGQTTQEQNANAPSGVSYHEHTLSTPQTVQPQQTDTPGNPPQASGIAEVTQPHSIITTTAIPPAANPDPHMRVKLYQLQDNIWEDKGTGHISLFQKYPATEAEIANVQIPTYFRVTSEEDKQETLLELAILAQDDTYELQGDSLIVWTDEESNRDLALSFQESEGCKEVWNSIRRFQGVDEDAEQLILQNKMDEEQAEIHSVALPEVNRANLRAINMALQQPFKDSIAKAILESNYLQQLFKLFDVCESESEYDTLYLFFEIFKNMILLNDQDLFQELFSERNVMRLMGALEYDPEITSRKQIAAAQRQKQQAMQSGATSTTSSATTPPRKSNHRHYLNNVVVFKKIIPFSQKNDAAVTEKIHRSFRIQYLKESILPRCLDDTTFNTLNLIICTYHQEITETIYYDSEFLPTLFGKLKDQGLPSDQRLDLIKLLLEYNSLLKNSTLFSKRRAYRKLIEYGLFDVLTYTLLDENRFTRQHSSELISTMINFDISLVRDYMLHQYFELQQCAFFESFIKGIIDDTELGVQENLADSLRLLTDPDVMDAEKSQHFLRMFYQTNFILMLLEPLRAKDEVLQEKMSSSKTKESSKQAIAHVLELLSDFVRLHKMPCKAILLQHDILQRVSNILSIRYQEKDLVLCIIRFLRSCMALCDEDLNRYIIDHDLFAPILRVLKDYHLDNNMLSSAVIEMIEFVHVDSERTNSLILYIGERYSSELEHMQDGIPSIRTFLDKYNVLVRMLKRSTQLGELNRGVGASGVGLRSVREESTSSTLDLATEDSSSSSSHHSLMSGGNTGEGEDTTSSRESDEEDLSNTPEKKETLRRRSSSGTESAEKTSQVVESPADSGHQTTDATSPDIKITPQSTQPLTSFTSILQSSSSNLDLNVSDEDEKYFASESDRADSAMNQDEETTTTGAVAEESKKVTSKKRLREENTAVNGGEQQQTGMESSPSKRRKTS